MQLGLLNVVVVLLRQSQALVQRRVRLLEPAGLGVGVAQDAELERAE